MNFLSIVESMRSKIKAKNMLEQQVKQSSKNLPVHGAIPQRATIEGKEKDSQQSNNNQETISSSVIDASTTPARKGHYIALEEAIARPRSKTFAPKLTGRVQKTCEIS